MKTGTKVYSINMTDQMNNIRNDIGEIGVSQNLKVEDKDVNLDGKDQAKTSQVEMDVSYVHNNALVARPVAGPLMLINLK